MIAIHKRPAGSGRRVLVVEDNQDGADSLRMFLELLGHTVWVARTGPEGVQAAVAQEPEVVLCDIGLPGLDGLGVARALRQVPALAATRLIALTGYGSDQTRRLCQEAGFERHFTKPIDPEVLAQLLAV
jgi:CheY-like chemotaxis protein